MVTAITMTYAEEAIGSPGRPQAAGLPAAISFTLETDGRLPSGQALGDAIEQVDAETAAARLLHDQLRSPDALRGRARGRRARGRSGSAACAPTRRRRATPSSTRRPSSTRAIPADLGARYAALGTKLPQLNVLGGCCGTDHRHVAEIRDAW